MGLTRGEAFPSRFLSQEDVPNPIRATVADLRLEVIRGERGEENKPIVEFSEQDIKPMTLNNTNWDMLEHAYGQNTDDWVGKPVEIYSDPNVMFGKKRTGGLRLRIPSVAPQYLTWPAAIAAAAEVGMAKDDLVAAMKALGKNDFNSRRDTAAVRQIIDAFGESQGEPGPTDADVPMDDDHNPDNLPF